MEQTTDTRWSVGCNSADEPACMGYQSFTTFARQGEAVVAWNKRAIIPDVPQAASMDAMIDRIAAMPCAIDCTGKTSETFSDQIIQLARGLQKQRRLSSVSRPKLCGGGDG